MKCSRCGRMIKHVKYFQGRPYGKKCYKKVKENALKLTNWLK